MRRELLIKSDDSQNQTDNHNTEYKNNRPTPSLSNIPILKITQISNHESVDQFIIKQRENERRSFLMKKIHQQSSSESQEPTISVKRQKVIQYAPKYNSGIVLEEDHRLLKKKREILDKYELNSSFQQESSRRKPDFFKKMQDSSNNKFDNFFKSQDNSWSKKPSNEMFIIDRKLTSEQKQIKIDQHIVYFPYEPYKVQQTYMKNVIQALQNKNNALLESPTGTGKTLCLLASVLSWVQAQYRKTRVKTKVIYMSRTHSQLKQVSKQLQKTCFRPNMAIFGSRQQLCVKKELAQLKGKQKIEACSRGIKLQRKILKILKQERNEQSKILEAACIYHRERQQVLTIARRRLTNVILDVQKMKIIGEEEQFCPYFYAANAKNFATLYLMPYNYLLDTYLLPNYKEIITDSIIIFDEAHNVAQAACEGRSLIIQSSNIDNAILEINHIFSVNISTNLREVKQMFEKQFNFILRNLQDYKQNFKKYGESLYPHKQQIFNRQSWARDENQTKVINKERTQFSIYQMFCGSVQDEKRRQFQLKKDYYRERMTNYLINPLKQLLDYGAQISQALKQTADGFFNNFQKLLAFFSKIIALIIPTIYRREQQMELSHFRLFINQDQTNSKSYSFGLRCLVSWLTFKDIQELHPKSIILTSGTLKPLDVWQKQLQMRFPIKLTNKHVINSEQIKCKIINSGPNKVNFVFTFDNMRNNKDDLYKDLIESLIILCRQVPHGVLLVFPSFRLQNDFRFQFFRSHKRQQLLQFKEMMFQEKGTDINMQQFKKKAQSSKGVILAMICRGRLSEGIDFPDEMCRAVIIVGIPYPNIRDPFIMEKKSHLQYLALKSVNKSKCLRGEQWYFMGTIRSLNQALGRVIRHANDYGMVFLFDRRYQEAKFSKQLPSWITQSIENGNITELRVNNEISGFYRQMKLNYKTKAQRYNEQYYQRKSQSQNEQNQNSKSSMNAFTLLMNNRKGLTKPKKSNFY